MSKFKIGEKVKVREDLIDGKLYGDAYFAMSMRQFKGIETEIALIYYHGGYDLKGCAGYVFTDEMLEPVRKEFGIGDTVRIVKGIFKGVKGEITAIEMGGIKIANAPYKFIYRFIIRLNDEYEVVINRKPSKNITVDLDYVELAKKKKKREEGFYRGKEGYLCEYIIEGDKTTIILPDGIKGSVKLYKDDKYDRLLGLELAYYKAKLNEAIKKVKPINN